MSERRTIKRYTNRKLYDKLESRYVTLEEIAWGNPTSAAECAKLKPVKPWWAESFAAEVVLALQPEEQPEPDPKPEAKAGADADPRRPAGRRRGGRGRKRRSGKR